jgi:hypothetical protein
MLATRPIPRLRVFIEGAVTVTSILSRPESSAAA